MVHGRAQIALRHWQLPFMRGLPGGPGLPGFGGSAPFMGPRRGVGS